MKKLKADHRSAGTTVFLAAVLLFCGRGAHAYRIEVTNTSSYRLRAYPVAIAGPKLPAEIRSGNVRVSGPGGGQLPSQADDFDGDGRVDELVFLAEIAPSSRARFEIKQGKPYSGPSGLKVGENFVFQNEILRCVPYTRDRLGLRVQWAENGKNFCRKIFFRKIRKTNKSTRVAASGPVRVVVDQTYSHDGWKLTQRYILYAGDNRLRFHLMVTNLQDRKRQFPMNRINYLSSHVNEVLELPWDYGKTWAGAKCGLYVDQGELLMYKLWDLGIYQVNHWSNSRRSLLKHNPHTNFSMGVTFGTPGRRWLGTPHWSTPTILPDGTIVNAFPRDLDPRVGRGATTKDARQRLGLKSFELEGGETKQRRVVFIFYHGSKEETFQQFKTDSEITFPVVNVRGEDGKALLAAEGPYYVREDFSNTYRWSTDKNARLSMKDGRAVISSAEAGHGIYTHFPRDFGLATTARGKVESISGGAALKVLLRDLEEDKEYELGTVREDFEIDVNKKTRLKGLHRCVLRLALVPREGAERGKTPMTAAVDDVEVSWPPTTTPEMIGPPSDFPLTDIALNFQFQPTTRAYFDSGYEIQVARSKEFGEVLDTYQVPNQPGRRSQTYIPPKVYEPGTYYARVRALAIEGEDSPWSSPHKFTIGRRSPKRVRAGHVIALELPSS